MFTTYSLCVNLCRFFPLKCLTKSDARAQRPETITGFLFFETTRKNSVFYSYLLHAERPRLFLAAYVNVIIIIVVVVVVVIIECTEKRYKYQRNESSETFRRVDRTSADFNRLGDFYDRDNAHGDRVFSDRDKREHGRYVYYIYEKSVCFFLVLPYFMLTFFTLFLLFHRMERARDFNLEQIHTV